MCEYIILSAGSGGNMMEGNVVGDGKGTFAV